MAEHQKTYHQQQAERDQRKRPKQKQPEPQFNQLHAWEQGTSPVTETPFQPQMDEHAKLLAETRGNEARSNLLMHLQRTYGNSYVQRLTSMAVQPKLTVSEPNDAYEQEADRVADTVVSGLQSQVKRQEEEEEEAMSRPSLKRQVEEEEEEAAQTKSALQRQEEEEEEAMSRPVLQRQVEEEEEEEAAQTKSALQRQEEEEEEAMSRPISQRPKDVKPAASEPRTVSNELEAQINSQRGGGQPLSESVRASFEPQFGHDFGDVRVHTDAKANDLSQGLGATAFATGQDIFFREGAYQPESEKGQWLLAHELTHVVQQNQAGVGRQGLEMAGISSGKLQDEAAQEEEGTLPDQEPEEEEEVEKGPGTEYKSDSLRPDQGTSNPDTTTEGGKDFKLDVGDIGFNFINTESQPSDSHGKEDAENAKASLVSPGSVGMTWNNPGGATIKDPFGCEFFKPKWTNASYKSSFLNWKVTVNFNINVQCPWGTKDGGRIDVPSATDAVVTKNNYREVYKDLRPIKIEKCWTSTSTKYWSKAVVEKHEKFHSTDDRDWAQSTGKKVVTDYLKSKSVNSKSAATELKTLLDNAIIRMRNANTAWYKGGASSYWSYAGEERAFGDGKSTLQKLSLDVYRQGRKLVREAKKAKSKK